MPGKYRYVGVENRGVRLQHRLVMERYLSRSLRTDEMIHHINHDKSDNHIQNLKVVSAKEHAVEHGQWKYPTQKNCEHCGVIFAPSPTKRRRAKTCSRECGYALLSEILRQPRSHRSMYREGAYPSEIKNRRRSRSSKAT